MSDFRANLSAKQVHHQLTRALTQLQRAEQNALLWFAEILHRDLYRELGYASIQQYASEALGFTRNKTYQFIRLAEALARLPEVKESVASGEIGWTKAREVVKVATPRTQKRWIREAKRASNRQLEQKVVTVRQQARAARRVDPGQQELDMASSQVRSAAVGAHASPPAREPEVQIAITLRFAPEQLARYEALLEKIALENRRNHGRRENPGRSLSREELVLAALEDHLDGLDRGGPDRKGVSGQDVTTGPGEDEARFLPRGKSISPYQIIIYQCEACGRGVIRTRHGTRELSPAALQAAACDARIQPASDESDQDSGESGLDGSARSTVSTKSTTSTESTDSTKPTGSSRSTSKQNRATIPPGTRRRVLARDRHRCRMKGCGQTRFLEVHHLVARARGGSNKLDNLVTLCASCHQVLHDMYLRGDRKPEARLGLLSED